MEPKKKRKLVRRYYAERYLLITIVSFAFSVSLTRFFLNITGYPQIGGGQLHIAHVFWGGLLLFLGGLFPLIFANKRAFDLSALFSGVGVGLFIDEVGKFITRDYNYFFPAAAPIIYLFFLLVVLVLLLLRRRRVEDLRSSLYHAIERFEEILEEDLSRPEQERVMRSIRAALVDNHDPHLAAVAQDLLVYLEDQSRSLVPEQPDFLSGLVMKWLDFEDRVFKREGFVKWLVVSWAVWGLITLIHPIFALLSAETALHLGGLWSSLLASDLLAADLSVTGIVRLAGEAFSGLLLLAAVLLSYRKRVRDAISLAMVALLMMLSVVNVLMFYFDQFSSFFYAALQFILLIVTVRFKKHYI